MKLPCLISVLSGLDGGGKRGRKDGDDIPTLMFQPAAMESDTDIVKASLESVGINFEEDLSRMELQNLKDIICND